MKPLIYLVAAFSFGAITGASFIYNRRPPPLDREVIRLRTSGYSNVTLYLEKGDQVYGLDLPTFHVQLRPAQPPP